MRQLLAIGSVLFVGFSALAEPPAKVVSIEGVTEYRLANGARVLLFPEASRPTITVNMTVLVGSPARGLRRDRHGPPARAHGLQGHADAPATCPRPSATTAPASTAPPTSTAPTTSRPCRPPTRTSSSASDLEADRLVNSFVKREDLDLGNDRRPQRVRARREQPRSASSASASTPPPTSGTTTANRPSATAPTSSACRSRTCRPSTRSTTSPITSS